jgi:hypothetical protein
LLLLFVTTEYFSPCKCLLQNVYIVWGKEQRFGDGFFIRLKTKTQLHLHLHLFLYFRSDYTQLITLTNLPTSQPVFFTE